MTLLAKRYATALLSLAKAAGAVDAVGADLRTLHAALASPAARALLTSPDVTMAERGSLLQKLGAGRHTLVQNTIGVLQHRRRLEVLVDLYPAFRTLQQIEHGEIDGIAEAPHALDAGELAALTELAGRLSGKKVTLSTQIRPELLGGVRLRLGNVLYDGSLQASLDQLATRLRQASVSV